MKYIKRLIIGSVIMLFSLNSSFSQGCSDAGFCTISSLKPHTMETERFKNVFKFGVSYGKADNSISAVGNYIEYGREFNNKFNLSFKLTSLLQSGNDISEFDIADLFIAANLKSSEELNFTAGIKIPFGEADKTKENLPLPMDYQASLGTFDLILGIGFNVSDLQISAAAQIPLNQNKNNFLAGNYPAESELREFYTTNEFKRSADILIRFTYPVYKNENLNLLVSLLPIYHISNDKFTNQQGIQQEIEGSKGLTLNGNVYLNYFLSNKSTLQLNAGFPFKVRDSRPDGLTRSFITNLEYSYSF